MRELFALPDVIQAFLTRRAGMAILCGDGAKCRKIHIRDDSIVPAIRPVRPRDAAACAAIYNYYIENTTVTMELTPLCEADFQKRIETITAKFPWLVYEEDGRILGYGYLSYFHERAAYRFTCVLSLFVDKEARGR